MLWPLGDSNGKSESRRLCKCFYLPFYKDSAWGACRWRWGGWGFTNIYTTVSAKWLTWLTRGRFVLRWWRINCFTVIILIQRWTIVSFIKHWLPHCLGWESLKTSSSWCPHLPFQRSHEATCDTSAAILCFFGTVIIKLWRSRTITSHQLPPQQEKAPCFHVWTHLFKCLLWMFEWVDWLFCVSKLDHDEENRTLFKIRLCHISNITTEF